MFPGLSTSPLPDFREEGRSGSWLQWQAEREAGPILPIVDSSDPLCRELGKAVRRGASVEFTYDGAEGGEKYRVQPLLLFVQPPHREIEQWLCHRYEYRVFEGKMAPFTESAEVFHGLADFAELTEWLIRRYPVHLLAWCHGADRSGCFRVDRLKIAEEISVERESGLAK